MLATRDEAAGQAIASPLAGGEISPGAVAVKHYGNGPSQCAGIGTRWHHVAMPYCELCDMELAFCVHGMPVKPPVNTFTHAKATFAAFGEVDPDRAAMVERIKADWLRQNPAPEADVAPYWAKYQQVFSPDGLDACEPQLLKDFANSRVGAAPGNMSGFKSAWNDMARRPQLTALGTPCAICSTARARSRIASPN
jgi:hypothetical protein